MYELCETCAEFAIDNNDSCVIVNVDECDFCNEEIDF